MKLLFKDIIKLFDELNKIKFRKSFRPNVNDKKYEYMIFHWNHQKFHRPSLSKCSKEYPKVYKLIMDLIKRHDEDFVFTSVIVNKNNVCKKHKDKGNNGESYIVGIGDYEGGELVIEDTEYNIKNKFIKFNGCEKYHYNKEFTGTRYSLVYYNHQPIRTYLNINQQEFLKHNGLKMIFRPFTTDYRVFDEVIIKRGYNKYKTKFNENQTWLDMGANIGTFTCLVSKSCKKVYSYEPEPDNYQILKGNIKLNNINNVEIFNSSITEKGIENKLYLCNTDYNKYQHSMIKLCKKNHIEINCKRFKDIMEKHKDINCIKMDIEGSEMEILESNDFRGIDLLIFEWSFSYDNKTKRLVDLLKRLEKDFTIHGNISQIYKIEIWKSYPRGKVIFCKKKLIT